MFSVHCVWRHTVSVCPTAGDVNFDHLGKAGLPGLSSVVTVSSLSDNNILCSDVFNIFLFTPQTFTRRP